MNVSSTEESRLIVQTTNLINLPTPTVQLAADRKIVVLQPAEINNFDFRGKFTSEAEIKRVLRKSN